MASLTQDVGLAGQLQVTVTFDSTTGAVTAVTCVNGSTVPLRFDFRVSAVTHSVPLPVGTTVLSGADVALLPPLLKVGSVWDWNFTTPATFAWQINGD